MVIGLPQCSTCSSGWSKKKMMNVSSTSLDSQSVRRSSSAVQPVTSGICVAFFGFAKKAEPSEFQVLKIKAGNWSS